MEEDTLCTTCGAYWDCDCVHEYVWKIGDRNSRIFSVTPDIGMWDFSKNGVTNPGFADPWQALTIPGNEPTGVLWLNGRPTPEEIDAAWVRVFGTEFPRTRQG